MLQAMCSSSMPAGTKPARRATSGLLEVQGLALVEPVAHAVGVQHVIADNASGSVVA